jgi:hypothetical protein
MKHLGRLTVTAIAMAATTGMLSLFPVDAQAAQPSRPLLIMAGTNAANGNAVAVFRLDLTATPELVFSELVPTGGTGGAAGNGGLLQFGGDEGAIANFGSASVTALERRNGHIGVRAVLPLAAGCLHPDSVALTSDHLYVVGTNCANSLRWPSGDADGLVKLVDGTAAQIAASDRWAAVTLKSGSLLQLPLKPSHALTGSSKTLTLPADASTAPVGAAFWGDILGFTPAHSVDSFALAHADGTINAIAGPAPVFPANSPCWVAKGPGNLWYTTNPPVQAISEFFTDSNGGIYYKNVPTVGGATDLSLSGDGQWLAMISENNGAALVSVYAVAPKGDLTLVATSSPIGIGKFNGVAISD